MSSLSNLNNANKLCGLTPSLLLLLLPPWCAVQSLSFCTLATIISNTMPRGLDIEKNQYPATKSIFWWWPKKINSQPIKINIQIYCKNQYFVFGYWFLQKSIFNKNIAENQHPNKVPFAIVFFYTSSPAQGLLAKVALAKGFLHYLSCTRASFWGGFGKIEQQETMKCKDGEGWIKVDTNLQACSNCSY
jgi:hypothetical protein